MIDNIFGSRLRVDGYNNDNVWRGSLVDDSKHASSSVARHLMPFLRPAWLVNGASKGECVQDFVFTNVPLTHSTLRVWGDHDKYGTCRETTTEN